MIKITFDRLIDAQFTNGLMKLGGWASCPSSKTKLAIGEILKHYAIAARDADKDLQALINEHCEKNEDGSRKAQKDAPGTFIIPDENEAAWREAVSTVAMELPCRQLVLSELADVPLTPMELAAVDVLLNDKEVTRLRAAK